MRLHWLISRERCWQLTKRCQHGPLGGCCMSWSMQMHREKAHMPISLLRGEKEEHRFWLVGTKARWVPLCSSYRTMNCTNKSYHMPGGESKLEMPLEATSKSWARGSIPESNSLCFHVEDLLPSCVVGHASIPSGLVEVLVLLGNARTCMYVNDTIGTHMHVCISVYMHSLCEWYMLCIAHLHMSICIVLWMSCVCGHMQMCDHVEMMYVCEWYVHALIR